jgi:hypothetical protein
VSKASASEEKISFGGGFLLRVISGVDASGGGVASGSGQRVDSENISGGVRQGEGQDSNLSYLR